MYLYIYMYMSIYIHVDTGSCATYSAIPSLLELGSLEARSATWPPAVRHSARPPSDHPSQMLLRFAPIPIFMAVLVETLVLFNVNLTHTYIYIYIERYAYLYIYMCICICVYVCTYMILCMLAKNPELAGARQLPCQNMDTATAHNTDSKLDITQTNNCT